MDTEWMRRRLQNYLKICKGFDDAYRRAGYEWNPACQGNDEAAIKELPTIERILETLGALPPTPLLSPRHDDNPTEDAVRRALGILRDQDEWAIRLSPDAPTLSADELHPLIWAAAETVWETGEYKIAAQQAAVSLSAHVKARAGSHLNERELVTQVFAPDKPKAGQVRLHLRGDSIDKNWQSRQQGLHLIAQGAFAGIRNIAVHDETPWTEHEALEHLAVLSVVGRWADETDLVKGDE